MSVEPERSSAPSPRNRDISSDNEPEIDQLSELSLDNNGTELIDNIGERIALFSGSSYGESIGSEIENHSDFLRQFDDSLHTIHEYSPLNSQYLSDHEQFELSYEEDCEVFCDVDTTLNNSIYLEVHGEGLGEGVCSADSRPSTANTSITVVNMPPTNKDKYLRSYKAAIMVFEDDYQDMDIETVLPADLPAFITELSHFMGSIREVV